MKNNKSEVTRRTQQLRILSLMAGILLLMVLALFIPMISSAKTLAQVGVDVDVNSTTSVEGDKATSSEENSAISKTEYDGSLKVNILGVPVTSSAQVNSSFDLEVFSENITARNEDVAKVEVSEEDNAGEPEVVVVYKQHGKLLGIIPVTIKSKTEVSKEEGKELSVESRLSWWSFLVAKKNYDRKELKSQIENNVVIKENLEIGASATTKARIVEEVVSEIEAHAKAQASLNS